MDIPLFIGLIALAGLGLFTLYSAGGQNFDLLIQQSIRLGVGFILMLILAQIRIQHIIRWIPWLYLGGIILLIAVLIIGETRNGSQRWINLGVFLFQPSEIMKLVVPMMVTWYLSDKPAPPTYTRLILAAILIAIPVLLVAKEPDLGTSLLIASSGLFVIFLAGLQWHLIIGFLTFLPAFAWVLWQFMHDYQKIRVLTLLDPEKDPLGAGYHIIQSKIAIGSGGLYGKGWLHGTQSHLEFLPERSTDFIFAVYSEELGLIGIIIMLSLYLFVITRGMMIAANAQDTFSRLLAGSLILTFFVYIFVNMGMVMGLLPVVGLPLPLISYGGTSIVTLMAGFGLLMAVHSHKHLLSG